ncbi:hypothetical protein BDM02DRAFT_3122200 [Thelephora ganbajun]|uniref:Uncharacterized protein n=1 Tax=Thelephora ganbajun TaxID=370292 RepID=A0ACB6Z3D6_THEGA|nr:hypothetical protein BDM02DRAFT_3122200 [Thelephora ganbajun]
MFFRSFVAAAIVTLVAAGPCVRDYIVKDGDICDKISTAQGVSTYQLGVINNGIIDNECSNLTPNLKICLGYLGEDCTTVYTVARGDTCEAIAAAHNVNVTLLHENNPQINPGCGNIYIGEVLCVASKVIVPPPAVGKSFPMPSTAMPAVPSKTPQPVANDEEDLPWCDEL